MRHAACRREDLTTAFDLAMARLDKLERLSWDAYRRAADEAPRATYSTAEEESWDILQARLSGVRAERRSLMAELKSRMRVVIAAEACS